jgi:hypothetical protein
MELGNFVTNVLAGTGFLAMLACCLFLMLPVSSIAASEGSGRNGKRLWMLAFYVLIAFNLYWLFNGFSFMQDVFAGNVFHADYWTGAASPPLATDGGAPRFLSAVVWVIYLAGLAVLGLLAFYGLASISARFSENWILPATRASKLSATITFIVGAALTYFWQDCGREWLMSVLL